MSYYTSYHIKWHMHVYYVCTTSFLLKLCKHKSGFHCYAIVVTYFYPSIHVKPAEELSRNTIFVHILCTYICAIVLIYAYAKKTTGGWHRCYDHLNGIDKTCMLYNVISENVEIMGTWQRQLNVEKHYEKNYSIGIYASTVHWKILECCCAVLQIRSIDHAMCVCVRDTHFHLCDEWMYLSNSALMHSLWTRKK